MPTGEADFVKLKARMLEVRAAPADVEKFKQGDPLTKVRMADLFFVAPVRAEGYDFDRTVRRYCQIATQKKRDMDWHIATGLLSVWNDLRPEFKEGGNLKESTLAIYSSVEVQAAISEKNGMPNKAPLPTPGNYPPSNKSQPPGAADL